MNSPRPRKRHSLGLTKSVTFGVFSLAGAVEIALRHCVTAAIACFARTFTAPRGLKARQSSGNALALMINFAKVKFHHPP